MVQIALGVIAFISALAAVVWSRWARQLQRLSQRATADFGAASEPAELSRAMWWKDILTVAVFASVSAASMLMLVYGQGNIRLVLGLAVVPAVLALLSSTSSSRVSAMTSARLEVEKRAEEVLSQEELAPKAWAARLAPEHLPDLNGFEIGRVYQAGSGLMAGDFFDVFRISRSRVAAVIGDVAGHGIESSITAFQAKYLLRVFLRQFRDPAQALEELNSQMSAMDRGEEFISLAVIVFDTDAGALRYASAGHPAAQLWHDREVRPLTSTGALLMLDPGSTYYSREIPLQVGDLCFLYTDGLAETRDGSEMFGEERIANTLRRDPGIAPDVLCKTLLEAARDFASGAIADDVAILAIRKT